MAPSLYAPLRSTTPFLSLVRRALNASDSLSPYPQPKRNPQRSVLFET
jgi:hypothetical protein